MGRSEKSKKKKIILAAVIAAVAAAAVIGVLTATRNLVWFRHGVHFKNTASLSHRLEAGETAKLDLLPRLSTADFKDSESYEELYSWAKAHPDIHVVYDVKLPAGASYDPVSRMADLSALDHDAAEVTSNQEVRYILGLEGVKLGLSDWTLQQMEAYAEHYPDWRIEGTSFTSVTS